MNPCYIRLIRDLICESVGSDARVGRSADRYAVNQYASAICENAVNRVFLAGGILEGEVAVFGDDVVLACVFMNDGMAVEVESNGFPVYIESAVLELLACIIVEKTLTEFEQQMEVFIASQLGLAR